MGRHQEGKRLVGKQAQPEQWKIAFTPTARVALNRIKDARVKEAIRVRIEGLSQDPEKQGKPMIGKLIGYLSLRAVGQRYRIIYKIQRDQIVVAIVNVGIRKAGDKSDVYELTQKLLRLGLLDGPSD